MTEDLREIRGLSVWNPHAHLLAAGVKRFETRPARTRYRGLIALHASKAHHWPEHTHLQLDALSMAHLGRPWQSLPGGLVLALSEITACLPTEELEPGPLERSMGNYRPNRYAWALGRLWPCTTPVPVRGQQYLWALDTTDRLAVLRAAGLTQAPPPLADLHAAPVQSGSARARSDG